MTTIQSRDITPVSRILVKVTDHNDRSTLRRFHRSTRIPAWVMNRARSVETLMVIDSVPDSRMKRCNAGTTTPNIATFSVVRSKTYPQQVLAHTLISIRNPDTQFRLDRTDGVPSDTDEAIAVSIDQASCIM